MRAFFDHHHTICFTCVCVPGNFEYVFSPQHGSRSTGRYRPNTPWPWRQKDQMAIWPAMKPPPKSTADKPQATAAAHLDVNVTVILMPPCIFCIENHK